MNIDSIVNSLSSIQLGSALTYGYLIAIVLLVIVLIKMSVSTSNKFHLIDTVSNTDGSASLTRMLQLIAGVTGTWVILQATAGKWLTVDIFGVYLAAMGISEGFTKWVNSKNQGTDPK
jgi:hypothetical protein